MNIKAYIDFFSEIADLERSQQFTLLERAEVEANRQCKLPIFKAIAVVTPIIMSLMVIAVAFSWQDVSSLVLFILIVGALLISRLIVSELNARVLHKGLLAVLNANN